MVNQSLNNPTLSIEELRAGDRQAFALMVDRYSAQIYRLALRFTNDAQDAEDVLQETFIKALQALPGFEGRSALSTWLYRIAVNEALMLLRKRKPEMALLEENGRDEEELDAQGMILADWCCLPEEEFLTGEARGFLDQAVQTLPETLRGVFVLRDMEGLSIKETADTLGLSETNVKTRLLRARLRLRQELSRYFGDRLVEQKENE